MSEINIEKGDIIICALAGDYGKPRPAVVIQSNKYNKNRSSVLICPLTTHLTDDSDARMLFDSYKTKRACIRISNYD